MTADARRAAEAAARNSYGRLVALLASRSRDIAAAEDALADAFAAALQTWPEQGVPDNPEAWLMTAARRNLGKGARHAAVRERAAKFLFMTYEDAAARVTGGFPDDRLKLMFVCTHPAINPAMRTPLMLQTVLGIDAARIAAAYVVPPATMAQRLVRAKSKIRKAGIAFATPDPDALATRLADVLQAVYAAFTAGWGERDDTAIEEPASLAAEAIFLGELVEALVPQDPEAKGLLALMLYADARAKARRRTDGRFIPLSEQDTRLWDRNRILRAENLLTVAARMGRFGRFQCEAAIQSVHCQRAATGSTNWRALEVLYDRLIIVAPSLGAEVSRAAVLTELLRYDEALTALDRLPPDRVDTYQPYWVARAHVLKLADQKDAAEVALRRAIALTDDPAVRAHLERQRSEQGDD